jgi:hypothetical protein
MNTQVTRIATLGFGPPSRLNSPNSFFYTDIDQRTGEQSTVAVAKRISRRSQEDVFQALLKMTLLELAQELGVDPSSPPSWVPAIDDALDANLILTASELHERLLDEIVAEEAQSGEAMRQPNELAVPSAIWADFRALPRLLCGVSLAFEEVERQGGVREAFIDPTDARDELVYKAVRRATSPIDSLKRLFGVQSLDLAHTRLGVEYLNTKEQYEPLGKLENILIVAALAWVVNLTTSNRSSRNELMGFWLCDDNGNRLSKTVSLNVNPHEDGVRFDVALADTLGRGDLQTMNRALEQLVQVG